MQERIKTGNPGESSEREKEFQKNRKAMVEVVSRIIRARRGEGEGSGNLEEIPFIDSLLQNYTSEDKVVLVLFCVFPV